MRLFGICETFIAVAIAICWFEEVCETFDICETFFIPACLEGCL